METMGDRIKRLREAKGWSQQKLADRLRQRGCEIRTRVSVSYWENGGTKNIKNLTFRMLVEELGTTEDYLLFGPDGPARDVGRSY